MPVCRGRRPASRPPRMAPTDGQRSARWSGGRSRWLTAVREPPELCPYDAEVDVPVRFLAAGDLRDLNGKHVLDGSRHAVDLPEVLTRLARRDEREIGVRIDQSSRERPALPRPIEVDDDRVQASEQEARVAITDRL